MELAFSLLCLYLLFSFSVRGGWLSFLMGTNSIGSLLACYESALAFDFSFMPIGWRKAIQKNISQSPGNFSFFMMNISCDPVEEGFDILNLSKALPDQIIREAYEIAQRRGFRKTIWVLRRA